MFRLVFHGLNPHRPHMGDDEQHVAEPVRPEGQRQEQRSFLGEVGIIVLGVLVALVIGEVANAIRQRVEAQRSMKAIRADMLNNSPNFGDISLLSSCAQRRLDELSRELAIARKNGRLHDLGDIGEPFTFTFRTGSWDSAVANRDVLFLDKDRVAELTDYHELIGIYRTYQEEIALGWARLQVLTHAPGRIDDNTLAAAAQTLVELRYRTRAAALIARLVLQVHQELGFPVEYPPLNGRPLTKAQRFQNVQATQFCQPLQVAKEPVEATTIERVSGVP